jgi:hypothetical protein
MKHWASLVLVSGLGLGLQLPARAQASAEPGPDTEVTTEVTDSLRVIKGFAQAKITELTGKTHVVYVPVGHLGFVGTLPFYRHEEDIRPLGQPWSISVDKVQSMRLGDTCYEHMVVRGKRKHLLAARVAHGPVELFNYTEITQVIPGGLVGAVVAGAVLAGTAGEGIAERRWYLRRGGELVQVQRSNFAEQMSEYFKDDAETVAALAAQQLHYPDMLTLVQAYNQRRLAAGR